MNKYEKLVAFLPYGIEVRVGQNTYKLAGSMIVNELPTLIVARPGEPGLLVHCEDKPENPEEDKIYIEDVSPLLYSYESLLTEREFEDKPYVPIAKLMETIMAGRLKEGVVIDWEKALDEKAGEDPRDVRPNIQCGFVDLKKGFGVGIMVYRNYDMSMLDFANRLNGEPVEFAPYNVAEVLHELRKMHFSVGYSKGEFIVRR